MFDSETRWFIRCDTCPDDNGPFVRVRTRRTQAVNKDEAKAEAVAAGWDIRDDLHRCPWCIREGRSERAS